MNLAGAPISWGVCEGVRWSPAYLDGVLRVG